MSETDLKKKPLITPILLAILFFVMAMVFRIIDIFVLQLHLTNWSIISSKVIPLVLLVLYVIIVYRSFSVLGIHLKYLIINIILGVLTYLVYFVLPYILEFTIEIVFGLGPSVGLTSAPAFFIGYFIVFYIINSFMEEGVFRGLMMRCFMTKTNVTLANIIQAIFFGFWHIVWPINAFLNGMDLISAIWYAVYYVASSAVFGIVTGYMFQKTSSLWGPVILHTLWNFTLFMLSYTYLFPPSDPIALLLYGTTFATEVVGAIIVIVLIRFTSQRMNLPELTPWDAPLP
ncbi:MAG: CPBP family intramembrane glutamic endopeptidase [Candidatus Hermodarchaeia archaeon]|jgi:membrane protease YdiL (CAAX protease family)